MKKKKSWKKSRKKPSRWCNESFQGGRVNAQAAQGRGRNGIDWSSVWKSFSFLRSTNIWITLRRAKNSDRRLSTWQFKPKIKADAKRVDKGEELRMIHQLASKRAEFPSINCVEENFIESNSHRISSSDLSDVLMSIKSDAKENSHQAMFSDINKVPHEGPHAPARKSVFHCLHPTVGESSEPDSRFFSSICRQQCKLKALWWLRHNYAPKL